MEIKRCPCCGGEAGVWDKSRCDVCVKCDNCGCQTAWMLTVADAIAAWNRRADNWTPVSTPPASGQTVITCIGDDHYELLTYHTQDDELYDEAAAPDIRHAEADGFYLLERNDGLIECRRHADIITHWMAIPEAPKGEN